MGLAARRLGEGDTAREALEAGIAVASTLDNPRALAGPLAHLGELLADEGGPVTRALGTDRLREALEVLEAADAPEAFGGTTQASLRALIADLEAR